MLIPVIMAGGSGSRLWPLSRSLYPKQFLRLTGEKSMLQETVGRICGLTSQPPVVICNEEYRFIVAEQLREVRQRGSIILEPVGRNTAPAIALAAEVLSQQESDPLLLVLAADHVIEDTAAFHQAVMDAIPLAEQGQFVTFGIVPTSAHTGYGYIQRGKKLSNSSCYNVAHFVEKPNLETANKYLEGGEYYWNSGMFLFRASRYLQALANFRPDISTACHNALANTSQDADFIRVDREAFISCPDESIDYAVMEKLCHQGESANVAVVPLDAGWNDIGSWSALWEVNDKDADGNVNRGDIISYDCNNCFIRADHRLVTTLGLDNLVIVDTKDALMVAHKDKLQDVKLLVDALKAEQRSEYQIHREVYRPWGKYDSIDSGVRDQVKRITVNPGEKLSLQKHQHRAEHWVIVSGTAHVTLGDKRRMLSENESIYIPPGMLHALENPGTIPLELIEVKTGSYLGEDDIERFEQRYGRVE
ncbi:MAG: mannose-1-phosphate guanylyltransferase/mannose-6-phosphate isomerase [Psychromonas sp.]